MCSSRPRPCETWCCSVTKWWVIALVVVPRASSRPHAAWRAGRAASAADKTQEPVPRAAAQVRRRTRASDVRGAVRSAGGGARPEAERDTWRGHYGWTSRQTHQGTVACGRGWLGVESRVTTTPCPFIRIEQHHGGGQQGSEHRELGYTRVWPELKRAGGACGSAGRPEPLVGGPSPTEATTVRRPLTGHVLPRVVTVGAGGLTC